MKYSKKDLEKMDIQDFKELCLEMGLPLKSPKVVLIQYILQKGGR